MGYFQRDADEGLSPLLAEISEVPATVTEHNSISSASASASVSVSAKHHLLSFNSFRAAASPKHHSFCFNSSFRAAASPKHHSLCFNSSLRAAASPKHHSLSFNSFQAAASSFLDVNSDALNIFRKLKDEILTNPNLLDIITDHLNRTNYTTCFLNSMKHPLQKTSEAELLVRQAVHCDDPKAALDKLWQFKEAVNPFTEKFIEEFKLVVERENSILQDLRHRKEELDRKHDNAKEWGKVSKIVYYVALDAMLISGLVLIVLGVVVLIPLALIPLTVAFGAMPRLWEFVKKCWNKFQSPREGERVVIDSLVKGTEFAIQKCNSIKALVEELELDIRKIKSKVHFAEFAIKKREGASSEKMLMVEIKFMTKKFSKSVDNLAKEVDQLVTELKKTTVTILETFLDSLKKKKRCRCLCMKFMKKKKVISLAKFARKSARALIGRK